ncbi:MAG: hypothetical protein QGG98_07680, partial [Pseudomonadales bacterium]|nr:hypothetical protein [Pseudomonadales bacterium]
VRQGWRTQKKCSEHPRFMPQSLYYKVPTPTSVRHRERQNMLHVTQSENEGVWMQGVHGTASRHAIT